MRNLSVYLVFLNPAQRYSTSGLVTGALSGAEIVIYSTASRCEGVKNAACLPIARSEKTAINSKLH